MRIKLRGAIDTDTFLRVEYSKPRGGKNNDTDLEQARSVIGRVWPSLAALPKLCGAESIYIRLCSSCAL